MVVGNLGIDGRVEARLRELETFFGRSQSFLGCPQRKIILQRCFNPCVCILRLRVLHRKIFCQAVDFQDPLLGQPGQRFVRRRLQSLGVDDIDG